MVDLRNSSTNDLEACSDRNMYFIRIKEVVYFLHRLQ
jgi:phage-related protein